MLFRGPDESYEEYRERSKQFRYSISRFVVASLAVISFALAAFGYVMDANDLLWPGFQVRYPIAEQHDSLARPVQTAEEQQVHIRGLTRVSATLGLCWVLFFRSKQRHVARYFYLRAENPAG